ncbi:MAG: DUF748 domain-containing protein [Deltaproteobacteria bacterium]|nr:DUF748 domain-containing protein [Deltaproteobacteria bacterium]
MPVLITGPFSEQLSQRLNRPVSVVDVSFSPFTFRLHLAGVTIGPDTSRKNDHELCRVGIIDGRLQPISLFKGKVVVENLHIDQLEANLVRYTDGGYTAFPVDSARAGGQNKGILNILPPWLLIHDFQLTDGTLVFHDLPTGRQHSISRIKVRLPSANRGKNRAEPTLSAMVNSSPILLRGQRYITTGGKIETRLSLQLKDIHLQQYLSYLPGISNSLTVTSGSVDATLEITFQNNPLSGGGPTVTGSVSISALALEAADTTLQLKVPTAQMVIWAKPLQSLYTVKELVMDMPQLLLPDSHPSSLMNMQTRLASLLNPVDISLRIDRLKVDNGSVTTANYEGWHKLHLLLAGFNNKAAIQSQTINPSPSASLTFNANRGKSTIAFQGETDPSFTLSGKISLQNMDANLQQTFLPTTDGARFTQGKIRLSGELLAKQGEEKQGSWIIINSTLRISNFSLHRQESILVAGKEMIGTGCTIHVDAHQISCQQLSFDRANFAAGAALFLPVNRKKEPENQLLFPYNNLTIHDSTAIVPFSQADKERKDLLVNLSQLNLQLTGMGQKQLGQDNLMLAAAAGKQGKVELSGSMQSNGHGDLQLAAADIDIRPLAPLFTDWLGPQVRQGVLQLKGRLTLPDNRFVGSFQLDDFAADDKDGSAVGWQRASGTGVTARLTPFSAAIKKLFLQQPSLQLSTGGAKLPAGFLTLLKKKDDLAVLPPVTVEQCTINNGLLMRNAVSPAIHLPKISEVEGKISPLQPATLSSFNLSGKMDSADFMVTGRTGINTSNNFNLKVNHFQLAPLSILFSDLFKIDVHNSSAEWSVSSPSPDSGRIQLTGLTPLPDSDFSLVLALLTDTTGSFSLPVSAQAVADPAGLVGGNVAGHLRQLRLQAVISTRLVLSKFLPELNLPRKIEFLPGETVPDFMAELADYATLLELRPHLDLILRGHMDEITDHQYLLQILQEAADTKRELENLHREQLRTQLLAEEEQRLATLISQGEPAHKDRLHHIEQRIDLQSLPREELQLPDNTLQDLARQRAEVILSYLTDDLMIPADRIELQESGSNGTQVDLMLKPHW